MNETGEVIRVGKPNDRCNQVQPSSFFGMCKNNLEFDSTFQDSVSKFAKKDPEITHKKTLRHFNAFDLCIQYVYIYIYIHMYLIYVAYL